MKKIIEYKVVTHLDVNKVMDEVNALIAQGFQPFGAICASYDSDAEAFYTFQAVVKYAEASV